MLAPTAPHQTTNHTMQTSNWVLGATIRDNFNSITIAILLRQFHNYCDSIAIVSRIAKETVPNHN